MIQKADPKAMYRHVEACFRDAESHFICMLGLLFEFLSLVSYQFRKAMRSQVCFLVRCFYYIKHPSVWRALDGGKNIQLWYSFELGFNPDVLSRSCEFVGSILVWKCGPRFHRGDRDVEHMTKKMECVTCDEQKQCPFSWNLCEKYASAVYIQAQNLASIGWEANVF